MRNPGHDPAAAPPRAKPPAITPPPVVAPPVVPALMRVSMELKQPVVSNPSTRSFVPKSLIACSCMLIGWVAGQSSRWLMPQTPALPQQSVAMATTSSVNLDPNASLDNVALRSDSATLKHSVRVAEPSHEPKTEGEITASEATSVVDTQVEVEEDTPADSVRSISEPSPVTTHSVNVSEADLAHQAVQPRHRISEILHAAAKTSTPVAPTPSIKDSIFGRTNQPLNEQVCDAGTCQAESNRLGTAIEWADLPAEAYELAEQQDKLVFLIHVSGNFKIPGFT